MELWIARDRDGELCLYEGGKPERRNNWFVPNPYGESDSWNISQKFLPELTWENSPKKVRIELLEDLLW